MDATVIIFKGLTAKQYNRLIEYVDNYSNKHGLVRTNEGGFGDLVQIFQRDLLPPSGRKGEYSVEVTVRTDILVERKARKAIDGLARVVLQTAN